MKDTSMRKAVWSLLQQGETTVNELHKESKYNVVRISNYIRALHNANYIESNSPHTKILHSHQIKLIKDTGTEAPVLYRGILTDYNSLEEIVVFKHEGEEYSLRRTTNLIPLVEALLKIGEKAVTAKEVYEKADLTIIALRRWSEELDNAKVLMDTGERGFKNSRIYKVDLGKAERLLSLLHKYRNHKLAFLALEL